MAKKTTCPITRAEFSEKAQPVSVSIGSATMVVPTKEFATGSLGWYLNAKTTIEINGKHVPVQIGMNLTIIGSKELPQDKPESQPPSPLSAGEAAP